VVVHELLKGLGLLDGIEVLAEEILHQRDLGVVVAVDEDGGDGSEARLARRGAAPLAGDDVDQAGLRVLTADDGLDDPHLGDRGGQLFEGHGVHVLAGLHGVWLKLGQRRHVELIFNVRRHEKCLLFLIN
jgi:hypothetical protein